MSKVYKRGRAKAEINMTPLIDITFQLIIFFLLTNNMIAEQTIEMRVPVLDQAQTVELGEKIAQVVINVAPSPDAKRSSDDPYNIPGEASFVRVGIRDFRMDQLDQITAFLAESKAKNDKVEVVLRADAGLHYTSVQPVMAAITQAKISKINLSAYLPDEKPRD